MLIKGLRNQYYLQNVSIAGHRLIKQLKSSAPPHGKMFIQDQEYDKMIFLSMIVFPCLHFSYGIGFIIGFIRVKLKNVVNSTL